MVARRSGKRRSDSSGSASPPYLATVYDGTPILASMGSLGHYMQETSSIGLGIRNFLHEGNGDLWIGALAAPAIATCDGS